MTRLRTLAAAAVAAVLVVLLTGCGGFPTSGPVNAGQQIPDEDTDGSVVFLPDGPITDATPQQIVEGFIAAGSGPRNNWQTAKEFLAPDLRSQWNPRAGVTVYSAGDRALQEVAKDEFVLSVSPLATVDAAGEMSTSTEGGNISLSFSLAQQSDGQWRIIQAPDGIVLDRNRFGVVYRSYALQFFDPTWTYLVPDERWFPRLYAATSIAEALVDGGPSAWLAESVSSSFVDGARLAQSAISVSADRVAAVALQEGARALGQDVLDRMQTQLEASLASADIDGVEMLVADRPLVAESVPVRSTRADARPLVRTAEGFGFVAGTTIERIPGLSDAIAAVDAADIEVDADLSRAAVRDADGTVVLVHGDGEVVPLDTRADLVAPTIDPFGFVWSVPRASPAALTASDGDGPPVGVPGAWPGVTQTLGLRVSRDGTRLAALVRESRGDALWVFGIVRDRDGQPTGLGERKVLSVLPEPARALTWLDGSTLAVVTGGEEDATLTTQVVGGFGEELRTPPGVTVAAGGAQPGGVRVRDGAGELYAQRGANWQNLASGILTLAVQQGAPR